MMMPTELAEMDALIQLVSLRQDGHVLELLQHVLLLVRLIITLLELKNAMMEIATVEMVAIHV